MRKTEAAKLQKGETVTFAGYEWTVYGVLGYTNGIDRDSIARLQAKQYDGYSIRLSAIAGEEYPKRGEAAPRRQTLINGGWYGVTANYKQVQKKK